MTLNIQGPAQELRDIAPQVIPGFTSEENCDNAAYAIGYELSKLVDKSRAEQGIPRESHKHEPSIYSECIRVKR